MVSEKLKAMAIAYHRDTNYHRYTDDIEEPNAVQHNEMCAVCILQNMEVNLSQ